MPIVRMFENFNETIRQLRVSLGNEVCALFQESNLGELDFTGDESRLAIADDDGFWRVTTISYDTNRVSIGNESGEDIDFMDCNTDDMVAVYEAIYQKIVTK